MYKFFSENVFIRLAVVDGVHKKHSSRIYLYQESHNSKIFSKTCLVSDYYQICDALVD